MKRPPEEATPSANSGADSGLVVIGRISGSHGVKGWVRLRSFTAPEDNFLAYCCPGGKADDSVEGKRGRCKLRQSPHPEWRDIVIDAGRRSGKGLIAHIAGVDDRDAAAALRGADIAIEAVALPEPGAGAYYWHQLLGLEVHSRGELLGRVECLLETGGNDVLDVRPCSGSRDAKERLLPWLPGAVIRSVDLAAGQIEADWDPEF